MIWLILCRSEYYHGCPAHQRAAAPRQCEIASRAAPDGYTLVGVAASMLAIAPHVYRKLAYDPLRDFVPVGLFILAQTAICVHGKLPAKSVQDVLKIAREKPGQLNMASAGIGSTSHLGGVLFTTGGTASSRRAAPRGPSSQNSTE